MGDCLVTGRRRCLIVHGEVSNRHPGGWNGSTTCVICIYQIIIKILYPAFCLHTLAFSRLRLVSCCNITQDVETRHFRPLGVSGNRGTTRDWPMSLFTWSGQDGLQGRAATRHVSSSPMTIHDVSHPDVIVFCHWPFDDV